MTLAFLLAFGMLAGLLTAFGTFGSTPAPANTIGARPDNDRSYSLHPGANCVTGNVLTVYAHQDDFIFFDPDLQHWLDAKACVTILELTAGDAGHPMAYWESRNQGALAAVGQMAYYAGRSSVPDPQWVEQGFTVMHRTIREYYLAADPHITVLMMLLPDGGGNGAGFPSTGHQSLYELATGRIPVIASLDPSYPNTYSQASLEQFLTGVFASVVPQRINTQDPTLATPATGGFRGTLSDGEGAPTDPVEVDHSDHIWGAADAWSAAKNPAWQSGDSFELVAYMDYPSKGNQSAFVGVAPVDYPWQDLEKWGAWDAYVIHDPLMLPTCSNELVCRARDSQFFAFVQGEWIRQVWAPGIPS